MSHGFIDFWGPCAAVLHQAARHFVYIITKSGYRLQETKGIRYDGHLRERNIKHWTIDGVLLIPPYRCTTWINQESRRKYWATRSSVRLFARNAQSFTYSALLTSLTHSAALIHSFAHLLTADSCARGKVCDSVLKYQADPSRQFTQACG